MSSSSNSSSSSDAAPSAGPFAWLVDVPCRVDVFLGTCRVKVRDCLAWRPNTVVPLDQPAGAELELRADQIPLAVGEVVVTGGAAGLRVTRILPPQAEEAA